MGIRIKVHEQATGTLVYEGVFDDNIVTVGSGPYEVIGIVGPGVEEEHLRLECADGRVFLRPVAEATIVQRPFDAAPRPVSRMTVLAPEARVFLGEHELGATYVETSSRVWRYPPTEPRQVGSWWVVLEEHGRPIDVPGEVLLRDIDDPDRFAVGVPIDEPLATAWWAEERDILPSAGVAGSLGTLPTLEAGTVWALSSARPGLPLSLVASWLRAFQAGEMPLEVAQAIVGQVARIWAGLLDGPSLPLIPQLLLRRLSIALDGHLEQHLVRLPDEMLAQGWGYAAPERTEDDAAPPAEAEVVYWIARLAYELSTGSDFVAVDVPRPRDEPDLDPLLAQLLDTQGDAERYDQTRARLALMPGRFGSVLRRGLATDPSRRPPLHEVIDACGTAGPALLAGYIAGGLDEMAASWAELLDQARML